MLFNDEKISDEIRRIKRCLEIESKRIDYPPNAVHRGYLAEWHISHRIDRLEDMVYKMLDYFDVVYEITPPHGEKTSIRKLTDEEKQKIKEAQKTKGLQIK